MSAIAENKNEKSRRPMCAIDQGALRCPCRFEIQYGGGMDLATMNTNFMPDFEQKIQHCYHNHFLLQKMCERETFTETVFSVKALVGL